MTYFSRPNLSSAKVEKIKDPAALSNKLDKYPTHWTKKRWQKWIADPVTEHYFLSLCEGLNEHEAISRENPVEVVHGLIADYDIEGRDKNGNLLVEGIDPPPHLSDELYPTYVGRTRGGGYRLVWEFEESYNILSSMYARFAKEAAKTLKLDAWSRGWDERLFFKPFQYYEIGRGWVKAGKPLVRGNVLAWLTTAAKNHDWKGEGLSIPIEIVREKLAERYPGKWPDGWDAFDIGGRGPRFWDDGDNPTAAVVRETGFSCFSGPRSFYAWNHPALLGAFANQYVEKQLGEAVAEIYWDRKRYWMNTPGGWTPFTKDDIRDHLTEDGLSRKPAKGEEIDEVTKAINIARRNNQIAAAVPQLYERPGPFMDNMTKYLNISRVRALGPQPDETTEWGEGFPWLAKYLGELFQGDDGRDLQRFLGWIRHAYVGALTHKFERGLGLIVAGPPAIGKNFLNKGVIGGLMGGCASADSYLTGGDKFNDKLMECPVWMLNDASVPNRTEFSTLLKRVVANDTLPYRPMYASPAEREWLGRVVITCNDDSEGLTVLPRSDLNVLDKLLILRGHVPSAIGGRYPSDKELRAGELPYFAAYLRDTETPAELLGNARFGLAPYADPELLEEARSATPPNGVLELLDLWRVDLPRATWRGTSTELYADLSEDDRVRGLLTSTCRGANSLGRYIGSLVKEGVPWVRRIEGTTGGGRSRVYEIDRPKPAKGMS